MGRRTTPGRVFPREEWTSSAFEILLNSARCLDFADFANEVAQDEQLA